MPVVWHYYTSHFTHTQTVRSNSWIAQEYATGDVNTRYLWWCHHEQQPIRFRDSFIQRHQFSSPMATDVEQNWTISTKLSSRPVSQCEPTFTACWWSSTHCHTHWEGCRGVSIIATRLHTQCGYPSSIIFTTACPAIRLTISDSTVFTAS